MSTLTLYYCSFCEAVNKFFANLMVKCEKIGTYRAASELARQGYYKEAKALMMEMTKEEK